MPKHWFTASFQQHLAARLREEITEWPVRYPLEVGLETKPVTGWHGQPDLWVARAGHPRHRPRQVFVIEIEHVSSRTQALRNVDHVVDWVGGHPERRAALLHLVHVDARLSDWECTDLFSYGVDARGERLFYDFRVYDVGDRRASGRLAERVAGSYDVQSVMWQGFRHLGWAEE